MLVIGLLLRMQRRSRPSCSWVRLSRQCSSLELTPFVSQLWLFNPAVRISFSTSNDASSRLLEDVNKPTTSPNGETGSSPTSSLMARTMNAVKVFYLVVKDENDKAWCVTPGYILPPIHQTDLRTNSRPSQPRLHQLDSLDNREDHVPAGGDGPTQEPFVG